MLGGKVVFTSQKSFFGTQRVPVRNASVSVSRVQPQRLQVSARSGVPSVGMVGTKAGMTQVYTDDGLCHAASVISVDEGNIVTQVHSRYSSMNSLLQVWLRPLSPIASAI